MIRKKIIDAAGNLFYVYGIEAVSMDDIALKLNISKEAIYENFQNKRELISECAYADAEKWSVVLDKAEEYATSPLEAILYINAISFEQVVNHCPTFFHDLEAYPEACRKIYDKYISLIWSKYIRLFFKCIEANLLLPSIDLYMFLDFFMEQPKSISSKYYANGNYKLAGYMNATITFLLDMCTDIGREELIRFKSRNFFNK